MHRWILTTLAPVLLAAPVAAQDMKALELVPDDALGFILVNDLRRLSDKVESAAKKLGVEERVSLLELIQTELGIRDGLNDKGSAIFIVLGGKGDKADPVWLFAVPASDHGKIAEQLGVKQPKDGINEGQAGVQSPLLAGLGPVLPSDPKTKKVPVLFAKRGDFMLVATPSERDALERVLASKTSIAAAVQPARDWLAEQDISGVCTQRGVKEVGVILMGVGVASSTEGQAKRMKETFAEVEKNVKLIAFGGRIDEPGHWRLATRVYFDPEGSYAKWIANAPPAEGKVPTALPDQSYVFAALARLSPQMTFEGALRFLADSLSAETADKVTKQATRLLQRVSEVGLAAYVDRHEKGNGYLAGGLVARVDDAPAFVKESIELLKQIHEATKGKDRGEVTFEQKKVADRPSWVIRHVEKKEPKDGKQPDNGGVLVLTELDAKTVLVAALSDANQAEAFVKKMAGGADRPLAKNPGLQKTAALLPDKAQLAAYLNVTGLGFLFGFHRLGEVECPPVGFALRTLPAGIEAQFVIPFETIQAVFKALNDDKKREPKDK
jgi:hypothetical protein